MISNRVLLQMLHFISFREQYQGSNTQMMPNVTQQPTGFHQPGRDQIKIKSVPNAAKQAELAFGQVNSIVSYFKHEPISG